MAFVKLYKNNAYFKRFQTKYRRRREGKTDYYARKRMITQDKNKYNTPKYRFVVRITSNKVITQVVYSTLIGDRCICAADSTEMKQYGLTAGLTNYSAAYATGLLCAKRLLRTLKLDSMYPGTTDVNGEYYSVEDHQGDKRPFKACLDVGLIRTTTGNRVFGALKGACDGGLSIPHSTGRFPGNFDGGEGGKQFDPKQHRDRIFGVHVDTYMAELKKESAERYTKQFSQWDKCLKTAKCASVEALMTKVHTGVRGNPDRKKKAAKANPDRKHKQYRLKKINAQQKRDNAIKKIAIQTKLRAAQ